MAKKHSGKHLMIPWRQLVLAAGGANEGGYHKGRSPASLTWKLNFPGVVAKGVFESAEEPDHAGAFT